MYLSNCMHVHFHIYIFFLTCLYEYFWLYMWINVSIIWKWCTSRALPSVLNRGMVRCVFGGNETKIYVCTQLPNWDAWVALKTSDRIIRFTKTFIFIYMFLMRECKYMYRCVNIIDRKFGYSSMPNA